MRVHRLEITGFGPFRGQQVIDFEQFADDGIFLITGKTGAGKSSILDAICFALYDGVPRYEGTGRRLRSDHARDGEPTRVAVEFSTGGARYRVERTPEYQRAKKHGTGFTPEKASAHLSQWIDGEWSALAARSKEVGELLGEIVGLTRDQFLQVILLAQNRFARFLQADQAERQSLLRTLFGTRRFEDYETALDGRRRETKARLDRGSDGLLGLASRAEAVLAEATALHEEGEIAHAVFERDEVAGASGAAPIAGTADEPGTLSERIAACTQAALRVVAWVQCGEAGVETAMAERTRLEAHANLLEIARGNQLRRDASLQALALLEEAAAEITADRERLRRARDAAAVHRAIEAAAAAETARAAAHARAETALREWTDAGEVELAGDDLDEFIEAQVRASGGLDEAVTVESQLPDHERAVVAAALAVRTLVEAIRDAERAQVNAPEQLRELDDALATARVRAATVDAARGVLAELTTALDAATQATSLATSAQQAQEALRDRGFELTAASAQVDNLRDLRLRGFAAELALELAPGEACAVCGSVDHPARRTGDGVTVTRAQIDEATAHRDTCAAREKDAAADARSADLALADAHARAGGRSLAEIEPLRSDAADRLAEADAAANEHDTLIERRAELVRAQGNAAAELGALREQQLAATAEHAQAESTLGATIITVTAARGAFATVIARRDEGERRIARARRLAHAQSAHASGVIEAEAARRTCDAELAAHGFANVSSAIDSLRSDDEVAGIDARVQHHGEQLAHHKSVLIAPELLALPEEPIDIDDARAAASNARLQHDAAVRGQARIEGLSRQLHDALEEAARGGTAVAALEAEYELIERLANAVAGRAPNTHRMKLEAFVLAAELEEIVDAANRRLALMSGERYRLAHSDALEAHGRQSGLGLSVTDQHTGRTRPTQSLSGGETFLASLALALGLAEVVSARAGGIRLDTLFIDEGFGSLDAATLDVAMATLDELRQGGRVVGLISHVDAMKEQIHAQLVIDVVPQGWSEVRAFAPQTGAAPVA